MNITNNFLTHNRPGTIRKKTTAVAVHWVANPGSTALANRNYFQNTSISVSSNFTVGLQGEIICCIPDEEISWCSNNANSYTVSIETCHPDWTGKFNTDTYKSLVELTAYLCKKYSLNPLAGGVIRHFDVTGKVCPKCFVKASKGGSDDDNNTDWINFKVDVAEKLGTITASASDATEYKQYKIIDDALNIRDKPGMTGKIVGTITNHAIYTIVATQRVNEVTWGKLKSGAGWISLHSKYVKQI